MKCAMCGGEIPENACHCDSEIVAMVAETLASLGCKHGPESHKSTPPMMYPEWICCVVRSAVEKALQQAVLPPFEKAGLTHE